MTPVIPLPTRNSDEPENHKEKTNKKLFATLAQIIVVITAMSLILKIGTLGDYYKDVFWNALGKDPLGSYALSVTDDDSTLKITGVISYGLASDIKEILNSNNNINKIILNSDGGRILEAENIYDIIKDKGIYETSTETGCASACTIPFLAGKVRTVKHDKPLLGFHSSSNPYYIKSFSNVDNERWKLFMLTIGISPDFIEKALSTASNDMWYPEFKTLREENITLRDYGDLSEAYKIESVELRNIFDLLFVNNRINSFVFDNYNKNNNEINFYKKIDTYISGSNIKVTRIKHIRIALINDKIFLGDIAGLVDCNNKVIFEDITIYNESQIRSLESLTPQIYINPKNFNDSDFVYKNYCI